MKIGPKCPKGGMRKWEVIISRALRGKPMRPCRIRLPGQNPAPIGSSHHIQHPSSSAPSQLVMPDIINRASIFLSVIPAGRQRDQVIILRAGERPEPNAHHISPTPLCRHLHLPPLPSSPQVVSGIHPTSSLSHPVVSGNPSLLFNRQSAVGRDKISMNNNSVLYSIGWVALQKTKEKPN